MDDKQLRAIRNAALSRLQSQTWPRLQGTVSPTHEDREAADSGHFPEPRALFSQEPEEVIEAFVDSPGKPSMPENAKLLDQSDSEQVPGEPSNARLPKSDSIPAVLESASQVPGKPSEPLFPKGESQHVFPDSEEEHQAPVQEPNKKLLPTQKRLPRKKPAASQTKDDGETEDAVMKRPAAAGSCGSDEPPVKKTRTQRQRLGDFQMLRIPLLIPLANGRLGAQFSKVNMTLQKTFFKSRYCTIVGISSIWFRFSIEPTTLYQNPVLVLRF